MKIVVRMLELQDVIKKVKKIVSVASVAILDYLYVEVKGKKIYAIANNLDNIIRIELDGEIIEEGAILIDKGTLLLLEKMKGNSEVTVAEGKINYQNREIKFGMDGEDDMPEYYPPFTECDNFVFETTFSELRNLFSVSYACDKKEEGRPNVRSVLIGKHHFVASDTYRIAKKPYSFTNKLEKEILLDVGSVEMLVAMLKRFDDKVVKAYTDKDSNLICFHFDNVEYAMRIVQEKYFNYENFKIEEPNTIVTINKEETLKELKLIKTVATKPNYSVSLSIVGGAFRVKNRNLGRSLSADIPILKSVGKDMEGEVYVNNNFLIQMLENNDGENVDLGLRGVSGAVTLDDDLILPIKIDKRR